MLQQITEEI